MQIFKLKLMSQIFTAAQEMRKDEGKKKCVWVKQLPLCEARVNDAGLEGNIIVMLFNWNEMKKNLK